MLQSMNQLMADAGGSQSGSHRAGQMAGNQRSGQIANSPAPGGMQGLGGLIQGLMPMVQQMVSGSAAGGSSRNAVQPRINDNWQDALKELNEEDRTEWEGIIRYHKYSLAPDMYQKSLFTFHTTQDEDRLEETMSGETHAASCCTEHLHWSLKVSMSYSKLLTVNEIAGRTWPNRQIWHPRGTQITVLRILLAILQLATAYFLGKMLPKTQTSTLSFTSY